MDDTVWIAQSQQELNNILAIAQLFFALTNIKVNSKKSVLAVVNTKNTDPDIAYGDISIKAIQPQEAFRILGCWYTTYKNHKPVYTIIREEAESAIKKIKQSRITDKQAIYIINTVILTRITYRVQNTCLPQRLCKLITNNYTRATKYKAGLARSVPNSTLFYHRIYGLRTVSDIQT